MNLQDPVTALSGVGEKRAETLATLGIETIEDLLSYYPFRYEDIQERQIQEINDQEKVTLKGLVVSPAVLNRFGYKKSKLSFRLMQENDVFMVSFFNQPYLKDKVVVGEEIAIYGRWDAKRQTLNGMKILSSSSQNEGFSPIYHVNKSIRQTTLIQLIKQAFEQYYGYIEENLPQNLVDKYRLFARNEAMWAMHFPKTMEDHHQAKRRVIFEEFFIFQMKIQGLKTKEKAEKNGLSIPYDIQKLKAFIASLPFELTNAQKKVTNEICKDLLSPKHMQRLLQGDVGSGKTIVAAIVLYAATTAGFQGALMVPTEILAQQHYQSLAELLRPFEVNVALLTGSTKTKERQQILTDLKSGELDIIIGTHALIQDEVDFAHLGLVITDEQHRFGVNQRKVLREKGYKPDVLFMTATPIPRTLAITAYGEMDVSIIDEMPAGRIPIVTRWVLPKQLDQVLKWGQTELASHHQMYVICPLIEESESLDVENAQKIYEQLRDYYAPDYQVGLLHGRMKNDEKDAVMQAFKENQLQVLVSTTVIEVGVNVPNATAMIIIDADRFGLAQLHQLRGRVGRGSQASYCILVANPKNEVGKERMKIMTQTNNGFVVSQKDLELRGPGEVFGNRQSGLPVFHFADIVADAHILEVAKEEAQAIYAQKDWQILPIYQDLVNYLGTDKNNGEFFD
ncbi:ATP-dependent DNA helicase RecG [Enterococcus cecorum]|uniref:ATP-dependent DNA helicase RecG n=1 Tax=Enterococcus cecorum DSM 20682 = ATCC 43198 TaxID=1121864 RepID=S1QYV1_9ENTE|nr:ATP-dependent DNA helicase RecG [Enterococcus cecorum]EOX18891.1 ATP-dependent DNA helicase RecG [Enterococcus cecorum DSM 20682 = ATCC 43198]ESK61380.1 ATP-dependent DNA helicase RecG [Enterococcus cecorum DSM 20682 = ATCC 43198]KLO72827.1 ATP-dependent DNA helicase [Enterococcus cecorum]KLO74266.1 ATP-dependent DNA helicase [Enterococcus cecorum]MDY2955476.1 ATP-dependent DNA helicase RecG [Enterococcus cecorum]